MKLWLKLLTVATLMSFTGLLYSAENKENSEQKEDIEEIVHNFVNMAGIQKLHPTFYKFIQILQDNKTDINNINNNTGGTLLMFIIKMAHKINSSNYVDTVKDLLLTRESVQYHIEQLTLIPTEQLDDTTRNAVESQLQVGRNLLNRYIERVEESNISFLKENYKMLLDAIKSLLPNVNDFYIRNSNGDTVFDSLKMKKGSGPEFYSEEVDAEITPLLNQALERRKIVVRQHMNEHLIPQLQNIVFEYAV